MKSTVLFAVLLSLSFDFVVGNSYSSGRLEGKPGHFRLANSTNQEQLETPVTEPPVRSAATLFAATTTGLIALNLQTLEVTSLTSEYAAAVAVNRELQKIYWSKTVYNCSIMRSNFDGSAKEMILPPTGEHIFALAVHEPSGAIYFNVVNSKEISVCNALGENCAAVFSNSSLVSYVWSIALDYENNVMYWSNYESPQTSLIRANLDGSNVTKLWSGFSNSFVVAITLEQASNDFLYWTDYALATIGSVAVNNRNKTTLVELESWNPAPLGIQVDANKIYFGNWNERTIQSVDRDSGEELTTIFNSTSEIRHLALFSAPA